MLAKRILVLVAALSTILLLGNSEWQARAQAAQDAEGNESGGSEDVTLRITGDEGTRFSGTCSVGEEEHEVSGRVPQSFKYNLDGRKLACEIRKEDAQGAELNVVLEDENTRSVQRSEGGEDTVIRLVYEDGNVSSSMSSTSSQKMRGTSQSSSLPENDATQGDDVLGSLADQIQKTVDRIIERAVP